MSIYKIVVAFFLSIISISAYAQLGFCTGSKGDPVFTENFGEGYNYGPALSSGTTNYTYIAGAPNDGYYTLFNRTNLYSTWHYAFDHTPDLTPGLTGKALIVNANANTAGEFYKRTVTGLCINTTFEFSAWVLNVYNPNSNFCGASEKPINVRFEIWNENQTILLSSGDTGNIMGTKLPIWTQYGLTFTTTNQTSVVLIMKNNGVGGCGNDLAIDDIEFRSCGDLTTITNSLTSSDSYTVCQDQGPISVTLQATTMGTNTYFYQWQSSLDGLSWNDIVGETANTFTSLAVNSKIYYRVKVAQDIANLSNDFCSTSSNIFNISFYKTPNNCVSNGNKVICSNEAIPALSVSTDPNTSVNWYDALTGGNLIKSNSITYTPTSQGVYYAETYDLTNKCVSASRIPVSLTIETLPTATISGPSNVCSGSTAIVLFSGTPNAIVTYKINNELDQIVTLNSSGSASVTTSILTSNITYSLVSVALNSTTSCVQALSESISISVGVSPVATISATPISVCSGQNSKISIIGTPNSIVTYKVDGGNDQTIQLDNGGNANISTPILTQNTTYSLVSVAIIGSSGCSQPLTQSITIDVGFLPTASISANSLSVCSGQNTLINFIGTPNAIVVYKVDNETNQTITLNNSGNAKINTPFLTANTTYSLVSVTVISGSNCSQSLSQSIAISVNPLPTASISVSPMSVCSGQNAAIIFSGTPNAIVTYRVDNGANETITLNGTGTATITTPIIVSSITYSIIDVTANDTNTCSQPLGESITIGAGAIPTATISANPTSVCSGQNSEIIFNGTPNAIVNYSENGVSGKSLTLNSNGFASIITQNLYANITYKLESVSASNGCSQPLSDAVLITLNTTPTVNYTGKLNYCSNEAIAISLNSDVVGTTFSWTVTQKGTSGATAGSGNQITQVLTVDKTEGTAIYLVTPFYNGCIGNSIEIEVTIYPLPMPTLNDGAICLNSGNSTTQPYNLNTNLNTSDYSFVWYYEGTVIVDAITNNYDAYQVGLYSVIVTNISTGCVSNPVFATVIESEKAESLIINQSENFSNNPSINITVIGGEGPFLYKLDNSSFQTSNVFYNLSDGTHVVTVVNPSFCTNLNETVTILNYPRFFTPNNDGYNDTWNIKNLEANSRIQIFDRYGKLLEEIKPNDEGWDGNFNGKPMFSNDYWFVLYYFENGVEKIFKSHFSLKR